MTVKDLKDQLNKLPDDMVVGVLECIPGGKQWVRWDGVLLYRVRTDKNGTVLWNINESCKEVVVLR